MSEIKLYKECLESNKFSETEKDIIKSKLSVAIQVEKEYREMNKKRVFPKKRKPLIVGVVKSMQRVMCYGKMLDIDINKEEIEELSSDYVDRIRGK